MKSLIEYFSQNDFHHRKQERKEYYEKYVKGWKLVICGACSGSGYYDSKGSPKCSNCNGTGKERVSPKEYKEYKENEYLKWLRRDAQYVQNN